MNPCDLIKSKRERRQEAKLKMLTFSLGMMRMHRMRNEYIRGAALVGRFGDKATDETGTRWFGHVWRRDAGYIGRRMLKMELPGERKRGGLWRW